MSNLLRQLTSKSEIKSAEFASLLDWYCERLSSQLLRLDHREYFLQEGINNTRILHRSLENISSAPNSLMPAALHQELADISPETRAGSSAGAPSLDLDMLDAPFSPDPLISTEISSLPTSPNRRRSNRYQSRSRNTHRRSALTSSIQLLSPLDLAPLRNSGCLQCRRCKAEFHGKYQKNNHRRHMNSVHGQNFACEFKGCGETFNRSDNASTHWRKFHSNSF
jgi:hypothetical protein